jgi:hypothetical protein
MLIESAAPMVKHKTKVSVMVESLIYKMAVSYAFPE